MLKKKMDLESPPRRILAGIILLILLVTICLYYANEHENHLQYPSYGAILTHYPQGALVHVYGTVTQNYPGGYNIQENYHDQLVTMNIQSSTSPAVGDKVDILGILGPDNTIISIRKIAVNQQWKYYFIILRSILAIIFLIYIFHRYWYFHPEKFEFRRR
jgi:uncharacterized integral membrane protein